MELTERNAHRGAARGRPRDTGLDAAIMDAVARLVGEHGFEATSIDAVAVAAGVGKATVYRRWPGKTELVVDTLNRRRTGAEEPVDTGDLRGDLVAMLATDVATLEVDAGLVAGVVFAMRSRPQLREVIMDMARTEIGRRFRVVLGRARRRGEPVVDPVHPDVELLVEVLRSTLLGRVVYDPQPTGPQFLSSFVDTVVLPLIRTRGGEPT